MFELARARTLITVTETGSLTRAARVLGMTKAAVSLQIKRLEEEVGAELLARTTHSCRLTLAGERFVRVARHAVAEAERAVVEARGAHESLTGVLRVDATAEYLSHVLAPALIAFVAENPRLVLQLSGSPKVSDLVRQQYDVAIRHGRLPDSTLSARKLGEFRRALVATPHVLEGHARVEAPADLPRLPWILHSSLESPLVLTGPTTAEVHLAPRVVSDSAEAVRRLALLHGGAAILPAWMVADDVKAGRLVHVVPHYELAPIAVHAVRPRAGRVPAKVTRLVDFLRAWLHRSSGETANRRDAANVS